jgi:hypothetical protein
VSAAERALAQEDQVPCLDRRAPQLTRASTPSAIANPSFPEALLKLDDPDLSYGLIVGLAAREGCVASGDRQAFGSPPIQLKFINIPSRR